MQILEASMFGLRSARMVFRHRASPVSVTLYPMVHVGEAEFYDQAYQEVFGHDVTLIEGVGSPVTRHLTRSYRWLKLRKLGLVLQPQAPPQETVGSRIVKADLSPDEFHRQWRKVSLPLRAAFFFLAPLVGMHRRCFGTRPSLASDMSLDDRHSADEILNWEPRFEPFHHSLLHARDQRLLERLVAELGATSEKRVAVVFGAKHIRAAIRELTKRGFYCSDASWRTILSL